MASEKKKAKNLSKLANVELGQTLYREGTKLLNEIEQLEGIKIEKRLVKALENLVEVSVRVIKENL